MKFLINKQKFIEIRLKEDYKNLVDQITYLEVENQNLETELENINYKKIKMIKKLNMCKGGVEIEQQGNQNEFKKQIMKINRQVDYNNNYNAESVFISKYFQLKGNSQMQEEDLNYSKITKRINCSLAQNKFLKKQ